MIGDSKRFLLEPICRQIKRDVGGLTVSQRQIAAIGDQCDQMIRLFFNIWPFATTKISQEMIQICQSRFSILSNNK